MAAADTPASMPNDAPTRQRGGQPAVRRRHSARPRPRPRPPERRGREGGLTGGGTEGNERLTVLVGIVLIVLLAALGITILRIGQLLWLHLFIGLLLIGPLGLKLLSTGYRFIRYYASNPSYRLKGPPAPALRMLAPLLVVLTLVVFASGIALLLLGPGSREPLLLIHKASFIMWLAVTAVHVLAHLPEVLRLLRTAGGSRSDVMALGSGPSRRPQSAPVARTDAAERVPGAPGRWLSMGTALVFGLVLAIVLIPQFSTWTHTILAFGHHY